VKTANARAEGRLLERKDELAAIEGHLEGAREGSGSLLLIEGPAGIGKTELLNAGAELADGAGMEVLGARAGELEQSLAYGVVRQLFEPRVLSASEAERRELLSGAAALAAPALGDRAAATTAGASAPGLGDPATSIQHGLFWLAANLSERAPLMLCVDDLQWADGASIRWLIHLTRRVEELPILTLATIRSGEPGAEQTLLASLAHEPVARTLRPAELSGPACAELVREGVGSDAEEEFCAACRRASDGNPFLLHELVEAIRRDGIAPTAASVRAVDGLAPETVSRSVLLRLARMPEGAVALTRAVAILGSEATPRHAAALAGLEDAVAVTAADALAANSILAGGTPLRFAHPLLRAAVYDQIPDGERALAHARAARLLAAESSPAEAVAGQLLHAEPLAEEWAVEALRAAASEALARGAPQAAVPYLRRALLEPLDPPTRAQLLRELLPAALRTIDASVFEGRSDDPVAELTRTPGDLVASIPWLAPWLFLTGRREEGTQLTERAIVAATEAGDLDAALEVELNLLSVAQLGPAEALGRLDRYEDAFEPDTPAERLWLAIRAWWEHFAGGPAGASAELARRALVDGRLLSERPDHGATAQAIIVLMRADELDEAEAEIERVFDDGRRRGSVTATAMAHGLASTLAYRRGDVPGAAEQGAAALDMCVEHGLVIGLPLAAAYLINPLVELGELDEAERRLAASGLDRPLPDYYYWFGPLRFARGRLRLAQGKTEEGLAELRALLEFQGDTHPWHESPLASTIATALAASGGDVAEARRLADWELARGREWGTPRASGVALRGLGIVAGGEQGIELLREAVEQLESSPTRLEHARALADLGSALRRANRRSEARDALREALELAHRCGAEAIEEQAREELAASGARPRRAELTGVGALTPSELRVARMAAEGMENKEIAQALFVTAKTVETHLGHVYSKLDISSRKELPGALG
jgi:DNA-binding NarL/FixJ family response regulator